jgi:hypothetical protein
VEVIGVLVQAGKQGKRDVAAKLKGSDPGEDCGEESPADATGIGDGYLDFLSHLVFVVTVPLYFGDFQKYLVFFKFFTHGFPSLD